MAKKKKWLVYCLMTIMILQMGNTAIAAKEENQGEAGTMTPYEKEVSTEKFYNGATFTLEKKADTKAWISNELERMNKIYHINTINVYGLESYDEVGSTELKDHLFAELARLNMKIVVRIESYDAATYAFTAADADKVMQAHDALLQYVCKEGKKEQVAYFALNMPVDDGTVQANVGGINSSTSKQNQVTYAEYFVKTMRETTKRYGFDDAKMYLSIFYGWDNSFETPSYASAKADGYFINNYSYPKGAVLGADAAPEDLINANRLSISMETFLRQYGEAPLVVEFGFHTVEYNNGKVPNQTAGVVQDKAAKKIAIKATLDFYQKKYPNVCGTLYFGYNLYKEEGNPPAVMDWSLVYPLTDYSEAEEAIPTGNAQIVNADGAKNGCGMELKEAGDGILLSKCPPLQQIVIMYQADKESRLGIYSEGKKKKEVTLPATKEFVTYGIPVVIVEDYDMEIRLEESGKFILDFVKLNEYLECEAAVMSGEKMVFEGTRGGDTMKICYKSAKDTTLVLEIDGKNYNLPLKASNDFISIEAGVSIASQETFALYEKEKNGLELDWVQLKGAPAPAKPSETETPVTDNNEDIKGTEDVKSISYLPAVICMAIAIIAVVAVLFTKKRK